MGGHEPPEEPAALLLRARRSRPRPHLDAGLDRLLLPDRRRARPGSGARHRRLSGARASTASCAATRASGAGRRSRCWRSTTPPASALTSTRRSVRRAAAWQAHPPTASKQWKLGILADALAYTHAATGDAGDQATGSSAYVGAVMQRKAREDARAFPAVAYLARLSGDRGVREAALQRAERLDLGSWGKPFTVNGRHRLSDLLAARRAAARAERPSDAMQPISARMLVAESLAPQPQTPSCPSPLRAVRDRASAACAVALRGAAGRRARRRRRRTDARW